MFHWAPALLFLGLIGSGLDADLKHFDPAGAAASAHTRALQHALRESLPFEDRRDFEESRRGLIAQPARRQIVDANGNIVWDMSRYDFLLGGEEFDSIHPSLQRQAQLNMNHGLFEVVSDFLYQVRGFDLANMTLVRGETGWILFDVKQTGETSAAALALANESLGEIPVRAVVYSHSHIDHFGGVHGVDSEKADAADLRYVVEMSAGTLTTIEGFQAEDPDVTVRINRADLKQVLLGHATLGQLLRSGVGTVEGNARVLTQLRSVLVRFAPGFEILPGTARQ